MLTPSLPRLGQSLRAQRLHRALTQLDVARRAGVSRRKVIQIEQGDGSVSMRAYAAVAAAVGAELACVPSRYPTLEEVTALFAYAE